MIQVNDCFYSKQYERVYIVRSVDKSGLLRVTDLFVYNQKGVRPSYVALDLSSAINPTMFDGCVKVDSKNVRKIMKLLSLNDHACRTIIKHAPVLKKSSVYFYDFFSYVSLKHRDRVLDIGIDLLGIHSKPNKADYIHFSIEVFRDIEAKVKNTLDLIDDIWSTFSESKENGLMPKSSIAKDAL